MKALKSTAVLVITASGLFDTHQGVQGYSSLDIKSVSSSYVTDERNLRVTIDDTGRIRKGNVGGRSLSSPRLASSIALALGPITIDPSVAEASVSATTKLLTSVGLGFIAAKKPNVLDSTAVTALSRLIYWIFQPSFLLCSISKTLSDASSGKGGLPQSLLTLIPLVALIQIALGTILAKVITKVAKLPEVEGMDVAMCTAFANSGPLPLLFADALFGGNPSNGLHSDVAAGISFYLLAWSPLFWTFGPMILGAFRKSESGDESNQISASQKTRENLKTFLSPPVIGSLLGVTVGSLPALRRACLNPKGILSPLYSSLKTFGSAYLPAAVLVLAGSLVPPANTEADGSTSSGKSNTGMSRKAVFSIMCSRFCLAPLMALFTVRMLDAFHLLDGSNSRARAVLSFVLLMEGCMPPAQNSVIMLQLHGLKERANTMAKMLALIYSVAVLPVTILLSACLALSGIMNFA